LDDPAAGQHAGMGRTGRVGVVVVTRDRRRTTLQSLGHLMEAGSGVPITVVDNASTDGTADAVTAAYPDVTVVRLPANVGAAGRNSGVAVTPCPYIAFSDDDSWWAPGALSRAADVLDAHPRLAVVAAKVLVGPEDRVDPVCEVMASSPLGADDGPGVGILGFVACGAVVRRDAFLGVGGFRLGYGIGGEEDLLAIDLRSAGWDLRYCPEVVAHHHPASDRPPTAHRRRHQARNAVRTAWLRRRLGGVVRCTAAVARPAWRDRAVRYGLADAVADAAWIWRERAPVDRSLEADLRRL
jgi:N-acetylglucosaminyl-diphospho-decaprenol L-rhamnosyltransferase